MKKRFWALDTALALLSGACLVPVSYTHLIPGGDGPSLSLGELGVRQAQQVGHFGLVLGPLGQQIQIALGRFGRGDALPLPAQQRALDIAGAALAQGDEMGLSLIHV